MRLRLQYFARLREERGAAEETLDTACATPAALYAELAERHGLSLPQERLMVVVNEVYSGWDTALAEGDCVVFIPPVSGG